MPDLTRPAELERLLSVAEIAERLSLKPSWVYTEAEAGRLPSFKLGKYRRFRLSEILAWLELQRPNGNGGR